MDQSPEEIGLLRRDNDQLRTALISRDVIGQAQGILMERHGIDAEDAFQRLVAMSQESNIKLRDVAQHLVDLRADLPTDTSVE